MEVIIRDLSEKNLDDHPCFKYGNERTNAMTKNWLRKVYSKFGPCVKVAYVDGKPAAMVQYTPMDIFPHVKNPDAHKTIVIHCIYIADKKYEGRGIAKKLMESVIQDMGKPHLYLSGDRFEKIIALAGVGRPGPAGPVEFFYKMGFTTDKKLSDSDVLVKFKLSPEE